MEHFGVKTETGTHWPQSAWACECSGRREWEDFRSLPGRFCNTPSSRSEAAWTHKNKRWRASRSRPPSPTHSTGFRLNSPCRFWTGTLRCRLLPSGSWWLSGRNYARCISNRSQANKKKDILVNVNSSNAVFSSTSSLVCETVLKKRKCCWMEEWLLTLVRARSTPFLRISGSSL